MILEYAAFGPCATNIYLIGLPSKEAILIDAPLGAEQWVCKTLQMYGLKPKHLLLTHSHFDHIAEASLFKETWGVDVWIHPLDAENLKDPGSDGIPLFFPIKGILPDALLQDEQILEIGSFLFQVIATPGHSPGSVCFYLKQEKMLFSGDTLFRKGMGRVDLPGSCLTQMKHSLKKLSLLEKETKVFPGHGSSTTIQNERSWIK